MPGYKLKVKGEYPRIESLLCPYCKFILKDAIQTEQGYRLCLSCYHDIQKDPNTLKSVEDLELEPNEPYHVDKAVRRDVDKVPVVCENEELGCGWSGSLASHEKDHRNVCQYQSRDCPNECGERLLVDKLPLHLRKECPLRDVQCPHCKKTVKARDYDKHLLSCPLAPYCCDSCGQDVAQTEKEKHIYLECSKAILCYSCNNKVPVKQLSTHLSDQSVTLLHLQEFALKSTQLEKKVFKRLDSLEVKINDEGSGASDELEPLKEEMKQIKSDYRSYSIKTDNLVSTLLERVKKLEATGVDRSFQTRSEMKPERQLEEYSIGGGTDAKIAETDRQLAVLKVTISELELQLQASLASTYNGSFLWRIPDIKRRRRDALEGKITSIYSPPFYTGRNGYKMCVRAYLNGDGIGYNTHLSIFFVLMKGEYDPLLKWPFDYKVSLILVDQDHRRHIVQTFKPSPSSSSFQKPKSDMNIASGCPKFAELKVLDNESYIKEDVMYIKCIVDTQRIYHP